LGESIGNGIGFDTGDQMMTLRKQAFGRLASGVIRVHNKITSSADVNDPEQVKHSVEQGTFVGIGPH
jgi:hypothetical protein